MRQGKEGFDRDIITDHVIAIEAQYESGSNCEKRMEDGGERHRGRKLARLSYRKQPANR